MTSLSKMQAVARKIYEEWNYGVEGEEELVVIDRIVATTREEVLKEATEKVRDVMIQQGQPELWTFLRDALSSLREGEKGLT